MDLAGIGREVHNKRVETGLLQEHVAKFSGLSRVTINQLENGTLNDLGYSKLNSVLEILGLHMATSHSSGLTSALKIAARSASTSYRDILTPELLAAALRSGDAPVQFQPHLMTLLEEVPLPVVVKAVAEAATPAVPAKKIMKHIGAWAKQWKVRREVW